MIFSKKPTKSAAEKVSSDNAAISFDLYTNLTYMAALSVGEPSRDLMMAKVLEQDGTFRRSWASSITWFVTRWGAGFERPSGFWVAMPG